MKNSITSKQAKSLGYTEWSGGIMFKMNGGTPVVLLRIPQFNNKSKMSDGYLINMPHMTLYTDNFEELKLYSGETGKD